MIQRKTSWDVLSILLNCLVQELALTLDQISIMDIPESNTILLFLMKMENLTAQHTRQVIIFPKQWMGGEIQIFADFLGGMSLKGEYVQGINSVTSSQ